jgi:predicted TIM-barrel fold metal-dependent hydrolase
MIIDSHTHIDAAGYWVDPPEALLPLLDEAGVDRAVVMTYRDAVGPGDPATLYIVDAVRRYPDRLIGYVRLNPHAVGALDALDEALTAHRLKGVKLHPISYVRFPYDEATLRVLRRAAEYRAPVLFHTGDEAMALPQEVAEAAVRCPQTTVIMGHTGGYFHCRAAIEAARQLPNVLLDTSAMPYPPVVRQAVAAVGAGRVLYASDGPGCVPRLEVEKVRLAGLSSREETLILGENIARLLAEVRHDR